MTVTELTTDVDLAAAPWAYPGVAAQTSGLLLDDRFAVMELAPSRRLGQAQVAVEPVDQERVNHLPLNYLLLRQNTAGTDARTLVVAIGSNASPGVMRRKLQRGGQSAILPMALGTLDGIGVGHSAHVSASGYFAAAPRADLNASLRVVAALLDDGQLRCLDATEPNYIRQTFSEGLTLDSGERPASFALYTSRWGLLAPPGHVPLPFGSQRDVLAAIERAHPRLVRVIARRAGLSDHEALRTKVALSALGRDEDLRQHVRTALLRDGWVAPSGLDALATGAAISRYGRTGATWFDGPTMGETALDVVGTADGLDRRGEPCCTMNPADAQGRKIVDHATVRSALHPERPGAIARIVFDRRVPAGTVGVDQVVRNALGIELGERAELTPAVEHRSAIADALIARPHYVMCRVQSADLTTVEQPVCLLAPLAMSILGVESGDEVVLEGRPADDGRIRSLRLRAHALPDDVRQRREELGGGPLDARFPSSRDALAVFPDLPWVFLDSAARSTLGLAGKLGAVRVRASRRYQWAEELRELLLVLVIALFGLATLITSTWLLLLMIGLVATATLILIRSKLRLRLRSEMRGLAADEPPT